MLRGNLDQSSRPATIDRSIQLTDLEGQSIIHDGSIALNPARNAQSEELEVHIEKDKECHIE